MADNILANQPGNENLRFVKPEHSGFQSARDSYVQNSFFSNNLVKVGLLAGVGATAYKWNQFKLDTSSTYLDKVSKWVNNFEERTPHNMGRTFGISDRLASYHAGRSGTLTFEKNQLISDSGALTGLGEHFQRLFGNKYDVIAAKSDLVFTRTKASDAYLKFAADPSVLVNFGSGKGTLGASSYRLGQDLQPNHINWSSSDSLFTRVKENFQAIHHNQTPRIHPAGTTSIAKQVEFIPIHAIFTPNEVASDIKKYSTWTKNVGSRAEVETFHVLERGQKLLSEVGFGARQGSYNRIFTLPGSKSYGLINNLLTRRVLPLAVGLTALKYLDYKTGHSISNTLVDIPLKANVARAELTDNIPGARSITDFYGKIIPGPQYGPLALPAMGAFLGGLYHYSKVFRGKYESVEKGADIRNAAASLLPDLSKLKEIKNLSGLKTYWKGMSAPAKGLSIGLGLMLPFVPGMLGSRKSARELRDIYSGDQDVPVRSGRWWSLGSSKLEGGRILAWRPHWSQLFKNRTNIKSLYGSEENYWSHTPFLHPIKFLKDPYYLEKLNEKSRPYPITSPAFTNIPLIGPLLAATIGKIVKPVKYMHEGEWSAEDYNVYSTRLNPRGPIVESKLERDFLQSMAKKGYALNTQVKEGHYRIDFAATNEDGKKIAIETDGVSYHGFWNAKEDKKRQKDLENAGWDVLRVSSKDYFSDPEKAANKVSKYLKKNGIDSQDINGRDIRSGLIGLAPPIPEQEFGLKDALGREAHIFAEFIGLPGYIAKTIFQKIFPKEKGRTTYLQGSRGIDNLSRQYYETNLGEGVGPNPTGGSGTFGYTEPLRRFIQKEEQEPQVNNIRNDMPDWLPGEDYLINFREGDPYSKVDQGYARLPGTGYASLHPEVDGLNPADYPDITKLSILADIAPYSREFNLFKQNVGRTIGNDTETRIRYEKILDQAKQTRESILQTDDRRFTGKIERTEGTIKAITNKGIELEELPGRTFSFSGLGMSASDLSAAVLRDHNNYNKSQVAEEVDSRSKASRDYISNILAPGTKVSLTIPYGSTDWSQNISAVVRTNGKNVNTELLNKGYASLDKDKAGAEYQDLFDGKTKVLGRIGETLSFSSEQGPLRFIPTPYHTKLWQERTALDQYIAQEVVGTRMRRWDRPIDDFVAPYLRGIAERVTGEKIVSPTTIKRRDLNTLADMLRYLRGLHGIASTGPMPGYTNDIRRTNVGTNLFASPIFVASTIVDRDKRYFQSFLSETDPDKQAEILEITSPEMAKTLQAQWAASRANISRAEGNQVGLLEEQGRLITEDNLKEYSKANTKLGYGDYLRSKEIAEFFNRTGFNLPEDDDNQIYSENIDYEDVKLKIIQNEGYDAHDFNIFDDRAAMLWRKPYIDGAVAELTVGGDVNRSAEQIRRSIEQLMMRSVDKNGQAQVISQASHKNKGNVKININIDEQKELLKDMKRNPEKYNES